LARGLSTAVAINIEWKQSHAEQQKDAVAPTNVTRKKRPEQVHAVLNNLSTHLARGRTTAARSHGQNLSPAMLQQGAVAQRIIEV
jgi:hypothetical protein